jgi:hypothetical protein
MKTQVCTWFDRGHAGTLASPIAFVHDRVKHVSHAITDASGAIPAGGVLGYLRMELHPNYEITYYAG